MSAPRKIWAYSMDAEEDTHGGWDVRQDDAYAAPQSLYHHDDVVRELMEALKVCRNWIDDEAEEPDTRGFDSLMELVNAALAKIAQEG